MTPAPSAAPQAADQAYLLTPIPMRGRRLIGEATAPYVLLAPLLILLVVFAVLPALFAIGLAFMRVDILAGVYRFAGLRNFWLALTRGEVVNSLRVTLLYAAITVPVSLAGGLAAALAMHALKRGAAFWRAVYFLPVAATLVAMSVVWRWMFLERRGIVDQTIGHWFGLANWLNTPSLALPAVAVVGIWQQVGFVTVLYLAGLAGVPRHLLEAARVDGAGAFHRFIHVTWPALGPTTIFAAIITSVNALRAFDIIAAMTGGGPARATQTLAHLMWQRGIYFLDIGGGAVVAIVLLVLSLVATVLQRAATHRLERAGTR